MSLHSSVSMHTVYTPVSVVEHLPVMKEGKGQKKCRVCNHKLLLSDMACRCGIRHCSAHRLPEDHQCQFDHCAREKTLLNVSVTACVADKMTDRV